MFRTYPIRRSNKFDQRTGWSSEARSAESFRARSTPKHQDIKYSCKDRREKGSNERIAVAIAQQAEQYLRELSVAARSPKILQKLRGMCIAEAKKIQACRQRAHTDLEMVGAAVRGASTKASPELPPNWSRLSAAEGRQRIQSEYGFDPPAGE